METPILFLIFNRPETTRLVFAEIKKARPTKLFVAADGPRINNPDDVKNCQLARDVIQGIDWPCEVKTLFQKNNLGAGRGSATAIDWFFENVEEGIVLEDDDIPDQSFFQFCENLLEYYRDNEKVMMISGNNFQFDKKEIRESYYFSIYPLQWGWASWRRAWKKYDYAISTLPHFKASEKISSILRKPIQQKYWLNIFDMVYGGKDSSVWDYQWAYAIWDNDGVCVTPKRNLITNVGFGPDATHTKKVMQISNVPAKRIDFPLVHPKVIRVNIKADEYTSRFIYGPKRYKNKMIKFIENSIKVILKKLNLFELIKKLYLKLI